MPSLLFRYDLNQIPYDYTVEVRNRFKELDLIHRVPDELWMELVFLYFFALITEEGFVFSPCYFLALCIQMVYLSFSPLPFASLLFTAVCKASSDNHFGFLFLGDSLYSCLLYNARME